MRQKAELGDAVRWFAALALVAAGFCRGAGVTVTVDLGPERAERLRALADDPIEARPTSEFTAVVTVTREDGEGQENPEDPCGPDNATFLWNWGAADCIGGGSPGDKSITLRYLPGQDGDMTVTVTASVTCGDEVASGSDSVLVVVPTWEPDLPITPGDVPTGGALGGSASPPDAAPAAAQSEAGATHAVTAPADQDLVAHGATANLLGAAHDPRDKRVSAETTETSPVSILPAWWPPTYGTLTGGTVDAAGRHLGTGVTWCAWQGVFPHDGDDRRTPPLPDPVGAAYVAISADFVDSIELAQPRENGSSIDSVFTDTVAVHVVDGIVAAFPCCVPWDAPVTVELSWVLGPPLFGLGGSGTVALTGVPPGEEALLTGPPTAFAAIDGEADTALSFWSPQHADGSTVTPGDYTFTLEWTAELAGSSATVLSSVTVTVFKVEIGDIGGSVPPQRRVVCVGKNASFMAKVTPENFAGSFVWDVASGDTRLSIPGVDDTQTVAVHGDAASVAEGDVTLRVRFTPSSCAGAPATAEHDLTVADVEIRNPSGGDPDTVICVNQPTCYLARSKPAGLTGTFIWAAQTGQGRLLIVSEDAAAGTVFCNGGAYYSPNENAETLSVVFVPSGLALDDGADKDLGITIAAVEIRAADGQTPAPGFIGAGQEMSFKAAPLPGTLGGNYVWSTGSADLQLSPNGVSVAVTAAARPAATGPHAFTVSFSPSQASTSCGSGHAATILVADLDVDSDNNEGGSGPARSPDEDSVEETAPGKFILVNHGDDDRDGVPDYADLEIAGAQRFVPLKLELQPAVDWNIVTVTFAYPGDAALPSPADFAGDSTVGNGYRNYASKVQVGHGGLRLWRDCGPSSARSSANYVVPGQAYTAAQLGFSDTSHEQTFWIEAIQPVAAAEVSATFAYPLPCPPNAATIDKVVVTAVAPDLGVNCNNADFTDNDGLRTGVPDVDFVIDDKDDVIEDQRDGALFWPSRDDAEGDPQDPADDGQVSKLGATDLLPFTLTLPAELVNAGFTFYLDHLGGSGVFAYENASTGDRLAYLKDTGALTLQLAKPPIAIPGSPADPVALTATSGGQAEYLVKAAGGNPLWLRLWAAAPAGGGKVLADQVKISFRDVKEYYPMYSLRSGPTDQGFLYPIEGTRTQAIETYGPACKCDGPGTVDPYREQFFIYMHGYNITDSEAYAEVGEVYKRLYWIGFRGNFVGVSWHGSQAYYPLDIALIIPRPYAANVENAFQTAPALRDFLRDTVRAGAAGGGFGAALDKTYMMAHSLGTQVAMDAMRLFQRSNAGSKLLQALTLVQPAFWSEMCWAPQTVSYQDDTATPLPLNEARSYTPEELRRNSWCFFFNQAPDAPKASVVKLINGYNKNDYALWSMVLDDCFLRNGNGAGGISGTHYDRPSPANDRVVLGASGDDPLNLAHQIPAMLSTGTVTRNSVTRNARRPDYRPDDVQRPQGQLPMAPSMPGADDLDAETGGWHPHSHKGQKGGEDCHIDSFLTKLEEREVDYITDVFGLTGNEFVTPLAQVWGWFQELRTRGAYTLGTER